VSKLALAKIKASQELERRRVQEEYIKYVMYTHDGRWIASKHLVYVCDKVQMFVEGKIDKQILVLQMPPQHGKSQSITETLPSWYIGKYPTKRVIAAAYGDDLAQRFGRRNKDKIEKYGKYIFGIELSKKTSSATEFELSNGIGSMICRGIMSGITGQAADLILIDDPIKNRQEADSETYRNRLWEEWLNSLKTRLSAKGKVILIQTRWHEDDLAGRIIKNEGDKVLVINMPCEAEENDIIGRQVGEPLFPEIGKNKEWLEEFKRSYTSQEGKRAWLALFQGRPTADEGNLIQRKWWKWYSVLPDMIHTIMSVDATFKDNENSDFVCIQLWGKREANIYLIDMVNARMDFPTTLQAIMTMKAKHEKCKMILVEDKANGSAIIQVLQRKISGVIPIQPDGGKVARVNAISPAIESGNVYLPEGKEWVHDFIEQCNAFPSGKHDDMVDAMSQALNRFIYFMADLPKGKGIFNFEHEKPKNNAIASGDITDSFLNY
jgi:predicted phage terminase large subunit-like protein